MSKVELKWKKLNPVAQIPQYHSEGASGFDFRACLQPSKGCTLTVVLQPGEVMTIPTGLAVEIPEGYEIQIRPRSGISKRTKLRLPNTPGTIDSDYRGEIGILMENTSPVTVAVINHDERIAQGVLAPVIQARNVINTIVDKLSDTVRGEGGFGTSPEGGY